MSMSDSDSSGGGEYKNLRQVTRDLTVHSVVNCGVLGERVIMCWKLTQYWQDFITSRHDDGGRLLTL
ncbi:hypothetical protein HPP92_013012 [Vanilla planifolia]|uniref:Uncharacterized protein n=1 Tax=Vanilla planifolia TaxID=51239 RepID=A0A835UY80_VANPL|nr:hypothetical protein HPP92_013012 [Vanilla planifolia]